MQLTCFGARIKSSFHFSLSVTGSHSKFGTAEIINSRDALRHCGLHAGAVHPHTCRSEALIGIHKMGKLSLWKPWSFAKLSGDDSSFSVQRKIDSSRSKSTNDNFTDISRIRRVSDDRLPNILTQYYLSGFHRIFCSDHVNFWLTFTWYSDKFAFRHLPYEVHGDILNWSSCIIFIMDFFNY